MKSYIQVTQHPLMQLIAGPISWTLFAWLTVSIKHQNINWLNLVLLLVFTILANLLDHYQYYHFIRKDHKANSPLIYYGILTGLILTAIMFMINQHIIIISMVIVYLLVNILQYQPISLIRTAYYGILKVFFTGFLLNVIAYYSQANQINQSNLLSFIPIVVFFAGIEINQEALKGIYPPLINLSKRFKAFNLITYLIIALAIGLGVYLSLPSKSFYLVQILFALASLFLASPLLVRVEQTKKVQNKLNYHNFLSLVVILLYSLAYLY